MEDKNTLGVLKKIIKIYSYAFNQSFYPCLILLFLSGLWGILESLAPYVIKIIIDDSFNQIHKSRDGYLKFGIIYLGLIAGIEILQRGCNFFWLYFLPKARIQLREFIYEKLLDKSILFIKSHTIGTLTVRFELLSKSLEKILTELLYSLLPAVISCIFTVFLFSTLHIFLSLIFFIWLLAMASIVLFYGKKVIHASKDHVCTQNLLNGFVADALQDFIYIKNSRFTGVEDERFQQLQKTERIAYQTLFSSIFKADILRSTITFTLFFSIFLIFVWDMISKTYLSLGDIAFVTTIAFYVRRSVWGASIGYLNISQEIGHVLDAINLVENNEEKISYMRTESPATALQLTNVSFSYTPTRPVINKLNLSLLLGENILIQGKSGCGKTTLMNLIMGFIKPTHGEILNICEEGKLSHDMFYIPQSNRLFFKSVLDNLTLGLKNVSHERVLYAAKLVSAHEFIQTLPHQYETYVGDGGAFLSGGQRQRILIARAILHNPKILILDEALASLEENMAELILKNLMHKTSIRSLMCVSHNTKINYLFDKVYSLQKGALIEE